MVPAGVTNLCSSPAASLIVPFTGRCWGRHHVARGQPLRSGDARHHARRSEPHLGSFRSDLRDLTVFFKRDISANNTIALVKGVNVRARVSYGTHGGSCAQRDL